jgi:hypothetical protein
MMLSSEPSAESLVIRLIYVDAAQFQEQG